MENRNLTSVQISFLTELFLLLEVGWHNSSFLVVYSNVIGGRGNSEVSRPNQDRSMSYTQDTTARLLVMNMIKVSMYSLVLGANDRRIEYGIG